MTIPVKKYKVYADTSVFGGCLDEEFTEESIDFFQQVKAGKFSLLLSPILLAELQRAPLGVQTVLASIPKNCFELINYVEEISALRDAYIKANVLGPASSADAEHIAYASIFEADLLVSWNFKHIVHFEKINGFQAINLLMGYKPIRIFSPKEVI